MAYKIIKNSIAVISLAVMGMILAVNISVFAKGSMFLYMIPYIIVIAVLYFIAGKSGSSGHARSGGKYFILFLFAAAFFSKAFFALYFDAPQASDFRLLYEAAAKAANGDFSFAESGYFSLWSYQTGIVLFYAAMIKVFGASPIPLKMVNCLFIAGTNVMVYLIARKLASEKTARLTALLYLFYPAHFFLASVLTNQHISNFLLFAGICVFMSNDRRIGVNTIVSAILLAFGNAMRPEGIVVIASFAVFGILGVIKEKSIRKSPAGPVIVLVTVYFLTGFLLSRAVMISGANPNGLGNDFPRYKFVVGLNHETGGTYSDGDVQVLWSIGDKVERDEKAMEMIRERVSDPIRLCRLFYTKIRKMWCDTDLSFNWGFDHLKETGISILGRSISHERFRDMVLKFEKSIYIIFFAFSAVGILSLFGKEYYNRYVIFFVVLIMVNIAVYCLVEIQPRYRYLTMIGIIILSSKGFEIFSALPFLRKRNGKR